MVWNKVFQILGHLRYVVRQALANSLDPDQMLKQDLHYLALIQQF